MAPSPKGTPWRGHALGTRNEDTRQWARRAAWTAAGSARWPGRRPGPAGRWTGAASRGLSAKRCRTRSEVQSGLQWVEPAVRELALAERAIGRRAASSGLAAPRRLRPLPERPEGQLHMVHAIADRIGPTARPPWSHPASDSSSDARCGRSGQSSVARWRANPSFSRLGHVRGAGSPVAGHAAGDAANAASSAWRKFSFCDALAKLASKLLLASW